MGGKRTCKGSSAAGIGTDALPSGSGHGCEAGPASGNQRAGEKDAVCAAHPLLKKGSLPHEGLPWRNLHGLRAGAVLKGRDRHI